MKKVVILFPRLDVPFKKFSVHVPTERSPIEPIRQHWVNVVTMIANEHENRGGNVEIIEAPLWQFDELDFSSFQIDLLYIPHRESTTWKNNTVPKGTQIMFYMQAVFPERFYIDPKGFAGGASFYPVSEELLSEGNEYGPWFDRLAARGINGGSKFAQPSRGNWNPDFPYILFPMQLPHDQTIQYHSPVSMEVALETLLQDTKIPGVLYRSDSSRAKVVVKGHPINPGAMEPLKAITKKYPDAVWVDGYNIHDMIEGAESVQVVNSGTGMEALLHKKQVSTFGRCEYDIVTNAGFDEKRVRKFFDIWCEKLTYDSTDPESFKKLP